MKIYIITQHETDGYITGFPTEGYVSEKMAKARLEKLEKELDKWSGLFYLLEEVEVNTTVE